MHVDAYPGVFQKNVCGDNANEYRKWLSMWLEQQEDIQIFIFEENSKILGFCKIIVWDYEDDLMLKDGKIAHIENICVDEKARGKQIGRCLFEKAKEYAKSIGAVRIQLSVFKFNKNARDFYEHLGMSAMSTCLHLNIKN